MKKKILAILLAAVLSVSMLSAAVSADGGEFTFDAETGTITGYTDKTVTELVIPAEIDGVAVTAIGERAFSWFESLVIVTIPDSVTTIQYAAFENCTNLENVNIPEKVTYIGQNAFRYCYSLETVTIPESVMTIGETAFADCTSLMSINVAENNNAYTSLDGALYTRDMQTFICCPGGKSGEFTIDYNVTEISVLAFASCRSLTRVTIPDKVTEMGIWVFNRCASLEEINVSENNTAFASLDGVLYTKNMETLICCPGGKSGEFVIPDGVITIDNFAFEKCSSLTSVTMPEGVTTVYSGAFRGCSSLTSVTIPNSVTTIVFYAFDRCTSLTDVYYSGTEEEWNAIEIGEGNDCLTNATIHFAEPEPDPDPDPDPNPNPNPQPQPQPEPEPNPDPEPTPVKTYDDVPETHWAADAISYVTEAGLFKGTSATDFSPNGYMTRTMLMVVLARLDGVDTEGGDGKWYEKGMEWAVNQGITDGSSPNENITRQQLVTMLWRYAGKPASNASLEGYSDITEVASWATEAMKWAVENGIIKGTEKGVLSPNGYATRAQVATIIMRFVEM